MSLPETILDVVQVDSMPPLVGILVCLWKLSSPDEH